MPDMPAREMAEWLHDFLPEIAPNFQGDPCWIAWMKTRDAEHNPPFYWLGRALDVASDGGATEAFRARVVAAHGPGSCHGQGDRDERVQDVLTEVCAYAWAAAHLGPPALEPLDERGLERSPLRLHIPSHDAYVAPRRIHPQRTMDRVLQFVADTTAEAGRSLPPAPGRILYLDAWHDRMYAQGVAYRLELTEPIQQVLRHFAQEHLLGHVLTRPFQWGNPVEAWY